MHIANAAGTAIEAQALLSSLAWALLDFVWQGALVGCVAAVLLGLLGRARPQWRYGVACAALLLCAALPVANLLVNPLAHHDGPGAVMVEQGDAAPAGAGLVPADGLAPGAGTLPVRAAVLADEMKRALQPRLPLVILGWSAGAALLALRLLLGLAWVGRRSRPGAYRVDPAWQATLDRMAARMGIARKVVLGLVDDAAGALASPVTAGCWRPLVLVPAALVSGMAPPLLEALLAHELAHVRRHDYLMNLLQSAIEILLFYHPVVWWLSHRIRVERELVADDLAASMLGEPRRLALALSELDLFQLSTPHLAQAAHGGNLMSRIKRLVRPDAEPFNWKLVLPVLGLALSAAVYAQAGPAAAPAPAPAPVPTPAPAAQEAPAAQARAAATQARVAASQARAASAQAREAARREAKERTAPEGAYALVRDDGRGMHITGHSGDWSDIKLIRKNVDGEFLWFRQGGRSYVIQDPEVLAKVRAAWAPVERLGEQMNVYGEEMNRHGKAMDALGKEMSQAATGMRPDDGRIREIERKMNEVGREIGEVGRKMARADDAEQTRLNTRMGELNRRMGQLSQQISEASHSEAQRQAERAMNEVNRRMDEANKPMEALGRKMDALGKRMEQESRAADDNVRALIRDAMAKGLAKPAPQA